MKTNERRTRKKSRGKDIFYWSIIAFPVLQFLIFYVGVNLNSFALSFETFDYSKGFSFVGFENLFTNFINVFDKIKETQYIQNAFLNSLILYITSMLIGLPASLFFSYYIYKRKRLHKVHKVILFLPNVISNITLVIIYKYFVEQAIPEIFAKFTGTEIDGLLTNPNTEFGAILFFTIWTSFGINTLIYSSTMSGISPEIEEAAKLDGITPIKELLLIDIPLIKPTISVFVIAGIATIFTHQMSIFSFYGAGASNYDIWTIGYYLYRGIAAKETTLADYPYYAAFGLILTLITIPITLLVRYLLNRKDSKEG